MAQVESWDDADFVFPSAASPFFACSESDATDSDAAPHSLLWASDDDDLDKSRTIKALPPSHFATLRTISPHTPQASNIAPLVVPKRSKHHTITDSDFVDLPATLQRVDLTPRRAKQSFIPTPSSRRRHGQAWNSQSSTSSLSDFQDDAEDDLFDDLVLPSFLGGPGVMTPPSSVKSISASPSSKVDLQLLLQNKMQSRLHTKTTRSVSQKAYFTQNENRHHPLPPATINSIRPRHKSQSFSDTQHSPASSPSTVRTKQHSRDKSLSLCVADPFGRASFALGKPIPPSTPPVTEDSESRQSKQQGQTAPPDASRKIKANTGHKVKRVRHHGDGTELDIFEDLPVDTDKERKFIKVSKRVSSQKFNNSGDTLRKRGLPLSVSNIRMCWIHLNSSTYATNISFCACTAPTKESSQKSLPKIAGWKDSFNNVLFSVANACVCIV